MARAGHVCSDGGMQIGESGPVILGSPLLWLLVFRIYLRANLEERQLTRKTSSVSRREVVRRFTSELRPLEGTRIMNRRSFLSAGASAFSMGRSCQASGTRSSFTGLSPRGRFSPTGNRSSPTSVRIGIATQNSEYGRTGVRNACRSRATGTQGICTFRERASMSLMSRPMDIRRKFGYKDICHLWKAEKWDPESSHQAL